MKVALMLRSLHERGGINVYTVNLIENILKLDSETEYLFLYYDKNSLGCYASYTNVKEIWINAPTKLLWDQIGVPSVLRRENVDIVFNPKLSIPLITKSKKLLMIHGAEQFAVPNAFQWFDRIYTRMAMPLYAKVADKILATTRLGIEDLSHYLGVDRNKFDFVHEGVHKRFKLLPEEQLNTVRQKYRLPPKYILFIGGLYPLKNFKRIVAAFKTICHRIEHKLVVVGFKRFKVHREIESAKNLMKHGKIMMAGFVPDEDLPAFYNMADCLVFPSLYEGFGLPVLEAMACNCPVVASKSGCTKEITQDAAFLVDPYNESEIAKGLIKVITNSNLRENLIEKGEKRVRQFSWEKCAAETVEVFRSMLN